MPWYQDRGESRRGSGNVYAFSQLGAGVNQHHVRGRRCIPQDIDFIIIRRMRSDERTMSCKRLVSMQMYGSECRLVFQLFPGVNVVERAPAGIPTGP